VNIPETQSQPALRKPDSSKVAAALDQDGHLLTTHKLVKAYRQRRVVNEVSIYVDAGEIVGLLGPNGAGKTTTFNIVVGLVKPDEGGVRFQGTLRIPQAHRQTKHFGDP
jgi:lipopolysaccharide export system ATP-binding protein